MSDFCSNCGSPFTPSITSGRYIALRSHKSPDLCFECWDRIHAKHCDNCLYFHQWPHLIGTDDGCCRINAICYYGFPPTTKSNWCGQWKEKP